MQGPNSGSRREHTRTNSNGRDFGSWVSSIDKRRGWVGGRQLKAPFVRRCVTHLRVPISLLNQTTIACGHTNVLLHDAIAALPQHPKASEAHVAGSAESRYRPSIEGSARMCGASESRLNEKLESTGNLRQDPGAGHHAEQRSVRSCPEIPHGALERSTESSQSGKRRTVSITSGMKLRS